MPTPIPPSPPPGRKDPTPASNPEPLKPATEPQMDAAIAESFPASDPTSTQREKPGAGEEPPDLRHHLPPSTPAEREAVRRARDAHR